MWLIKPGILGEDAQQRIHRALSCRDFNLIIISGPKRNRIRFPMVGRSFSTSLISLQLNPFELLPTLHLPPTLQKVSLGMQVEYERELRDKD